MYPIKPGWKPPTSAEDISRFIHQSLIGDIFGPFACHAQARYKYVEGYRSQPTASLAVGTAYDRTKYGVRGVTAAHAEEAEKRDGYFKQQLKTGEMPSLEDTRGLFASAWDEESQDVADLSVTDKKDIANRMDKATVAWRKNIAPTLEPRDLHVDGSIPIVGEDWYLRGSLDMTAYYIDPKTRKRVNGRAHPRDTKTSKSAWGVGKADNLIQGVHYSLIIGSKQGFEDVDKDLFVYDVAVKNKTKANVSEHVQKIDDAMRQTHLRRCSATRDVIASLWGSGNWLPNRESLTCSRSNCGYWEQCEKDYGGRVRGEAKVGTKTQHATTTKKETFPV